MDGDRCDDGVGPKPSHGEGEEAEFTSAIPPVRRLALRFLREAHEPRANQYVSMDGFTLPNLTFEQVTELEQTLASQVAQGVHPAYLCEMVPETSRFFLDLDLKHKGELSHKWLLELCSFLTWQIGQIHPRKVVVVALLSGGEIVTEVLKGKVHRRPKQRLEKGFATLLKLNAALMTNEPALADCAREPDAVTRKTGVHLYTNTCIPASQFNHLIDFLASSAVQRFTEHPKGVCLADPLSQCFDKPSSLRVPLCNKMGKCQHCTGKKPQNCPACLGRGITDHGKPYGVAWVLSSERGAVAHENALCEQLQNPVKLLAATRLRRYPEAQDSIGTHSAELAVPASMLKVDPKAFNPRACGPGTQLDVATIKAFTSVLRTVRKEWADLTPTGAEIMTAAPSGVKYVRVKFGGLNVPPSNFFCPTKVAYHKTLPLFLRWSQKQVRACCMHPSCVIKCQAGAQQEVKLSITDRDTLSLLFTMLVRPAELQLTQAPKHPVAQAPQEPRGAQFTCFQQATQKGAMAFSEARLFEASKRPREERTELADLKLVHQAHQAQLSQLSGKVQTQSLSKEGASQGQPPKKKNRTTMM